MSTRTYTKATFEMLWDCRGCGRVGNLGVTHRHCPGCGAAQDPSARYFPKPGQRVATQAHGTGPDVTCSYCSSPNAREQSHCCNCGASLAGARTVHVRPSIPEHAGETGDDALRDQRAREQQRREQIKAHHMPEAIRARERARVQAHRPTPIADDVSEIDMSAIGRMRFDPRMLWALGAVLLAVLLIAAFTWKRDVDVRVAGHTWTRQISIEQYHARHDSDWCTSMPGDAYSVSRSRQLHHTDRVPDGQDCRTEPGSCRETCRNVDRGNGSGSTVCTETCSQPRQVCTTRYRDVPVYRDKCSYTIDRWDHTRWATASGRGLTPEPTWPVPEYDRCTITRLGCEREGPRKQAYTVHLTSAESETFECEFDQRAWSSLSVGSEIRAQVRVLLGRLDCNSLLHSPTR